MALNNISVNFGLSSVQELVSSVQGVGDGSTSVLYSSAADGISGAAGALGKASELLRSEQAGECTVSVHQTVINHLLDAEAVRARLAESKVASLDVAFDDNCLILAASLVLGPFKTPRQEHRIPLTAADDALILDLTRIFAIPIAGPKISAAIQDKLAEVRFVSVERIGNFFELRHHEFICTGVNARSGQLSLTLARRAAAGGGAS